MSVETYNSTTDFTSGINVSQFYDEIENDPAITTALGNPGVTLSGTTVTVTFVAIISGSEKTALDTLVANHVPVFSDADNIFNDGRINIESTLADNQAIIINASNTVGGVVIQSGTGSTSVSSTNAILLTAGAQSEFMTTAGNLVFDSAALINLTAVSGVNIGADTVSAPVNIATGSAAKDVTIGNSTGASSTSIMTGTGGFTVDSNSEISLDASGAASNFTLASTGNAQDLTIALTGATDSSIHLSSTGTGADAICLTTSAGGIQFNSTGMINIISDLNSGGAITLDTSSSGGGITLSSGSFGFIVQVAFGGLCNIGNDTSTGDINIGTGASERDVVVGSTTNASSTTLQSGTGGLSLTSTDAVTINATGALELNSSSSAVSVGNNTSAQNINIGTGAGSKSLALGSTNSGSSTSISAGTGGLTIGNDANSGEIQIGNVSQDKSIIVSNNSSNTRLVTRWGNSGNIKHQPAESTFGDFNNAASMFNVRSQILTVPPTADRTMTLPDASTVVGDWSGTQVNDCFDFSIINNSTDANAANVTVVMGSGGTAVGDMVVRSRSNTANDFYTSGSGLFRLRVTNITASSEAYTVYRLA